jgi:hypothetical protein
MANDPAFVIVHCSDSPDYPKDDPKFDSIGAKQINEWHIARGWIGLGYHHVIRQTGVVEVGRPETELGAHCKGHNQGSIGVCIVGKGEPTPEQKDALACLFIDIAKRWKIPVNKWFCHNQFDQNKTCPNASAETVRLWILNPKS